MVGDVAGYQDYQDTDCRDESRYQSLSTFFDSLDFSFEDLYTSYNWLDHAYQSEVQQELIEGKTGSKVDHVS